MTFPSRSVRDMEQQKFRESGSDIKVAVTIEQDSPLSVEQIKTIMEQIAIAPDRERVFTWADRGNTKLERVVSIVLTAASVGAYTLTINFNYDLVDGEYYVASEQRVLT